MQGRGTCSLGARRVIDILHGLARSASRGEEIQSKTLPPVSQVKPVWEAAGPAGDQAGLLGRGQATSSSEWSEEMDLQPQGNMMCGIPGLTVWRREAEGVRASGHPFEAAHEDPSKSQRGISWVLGVCVPSLCQCMCRTPGRLASSPASWGMLESCFLCVVASF